MTAPDAAPPTPRRPDRAVVRAWIRMVGVFYAVFLPVYFGAGAVAAHADRARVLAFPFEAGIPLVPWMIWPYLSIGTLFLLLLRSYSGKTKNNLYVNSQLGCIAPAVAYIAENYMEEISVEKLSYLCHVSTSHFRRLFKQVLGWSPLDYIQIVRITMI